MEARLQSSRRGTVFALLSAITYGLSVPLSKLLQDGVTSLQLSALLYLGAGIGCGALLVFRKVSKRQSTEASLSSKDLPAIALMLAINTASIISLMYGIQFTVPENASLLVNFEIVATALFAWMVFHENIGRRMWAAIALICASSVLLGWEGKDMLVFTPGSLLIVLACALWGLENCCTKSLSDKDPLQTTCIKGFGTAAIAGAFALGFDGLPTLAPLYLGGSLCVGVISYGLSIALYISAQRMLGAARTANYYAIAPFVGVLLSWGIFGFVPDAIFFVALALMAVGTVLTLIDHHEHEHAHTACEHEHSHDHLDGHHLHAHPGLDPSMVHSHPHVHAQFTHAHEHTPDIHHSHTHKHA